MINCIVLMGRLTAEPEFKNVGANNTAVVSFTVAVDRNYTAGGEKQTDFINCQAWRNTAEFIHNYFHKGNMIAVEGSLQSRKFTDKQGNNRTAWEVVASRASFCGGKNEQEQERPRAAKKENVNVEFDTSDFDTDEYNVETGEYNEELPF